MGSSAAAAVLPESSSSQQQQPRYPSWHSAAAGGVAGFGSRMVTAPLDLIRIRRQLAVGVVYPSETIWQTWKSVMREEGGVAALYKGNLAAIYLWVGYAATQFAVYNHVKKEVLPAELNATASAFASGAVAGLCATAVTYPFDVCRTTFVAQGVSPAAAATTTTTTSTLRNNNRSTGTVASAHHCEPVWHHPSHPAAPPSIDRVLHSERRAPLPFSSLYEPSHHYRSFPPPSSPSPPSIPPSHKLTFQDFAVTLYRQKGLPGFYAGASPALLQIIPYMGLNFAIYDFLSDHATAANSAYAGSISGALSKIAVYPLDTVKRRLQAQAFLTADKASGQTIYAGLCDCFRTIYQQEAGLPAFYRGMVPSVLKTAISSSLSFAFYRWTKNVLEATHDARSNSVS